MFVGIPRLVELCSDPVQRNHSDSVLLACLVYATLFCPFLWENGANATYAETTTVWALGRPSAHSHS